MMFRACACARLALVILCLSAPSAAAQPGVVDRVGGLIEALKDRMNQWGEKTEGVVGPSVIDAPGNIEQVDLTGLATETRDIEQEFAANRFHTLSLTNQFGAIRVQSWENSVIRVRAQVSASAQNAETAAQLAQAIDVNYSPGDRILEVDTVYPDPRGLGTVYMKVNFDIYVPRDSGVMIDNSFGDTEARAIGGPVTIESLGGPVHLERIGGPVTVRSRGEYPVIATGLAKGGTFVMRGAFAQLADVAGTLEISNFDGSVELRQLEPDLDADINTTNGPIHVYLPDSATPDVDAVVLYGSEIQGTPIQSDFPLDYPRRGNFTYGRMTNPDSTQKLTLNAAFANIFLHREGESSDNRMFEGGVYLLSKQLSPMNAPCPAGFELVVDAMPGDIRIQGTDSEEVVVTASKLIRLEHQEDADRAFSALELRLETIENRLEVHSAMLEDLQSLGAASARLDLTILCPRTIPIRIRADKGQTVVEGTGAPMTVVQVEGDITVRHHKASLNLTNQKGNIEVTECEGPATINGSYGTVNAFNVFGRLETQSFKGKTIIEAPQGEVVTRSRAGDVKIIATDLIGGNYDVATEDGNISIILSPTANATVLATASKGGVVKNNSAIPLTGSKLKGLEDFSGRFNDGLFNIELKSTNGDIIITQEQ